MPQRTCVHQHTLAAWAVASPVTPNDVDSLRRNQGQAVCRPRLRLVLRRGKWQDQNDAGSTRPGREVRWDGVLLGHRDCAAGGLEQSSNNLVRSSPYSMVMHISPDMPYRLNGDVSRAMSPRSSKITYELKLSQFVPPEMEADVWAGPPFRTRVGRESGRCG